MKPANICRFLGHRYRFDLPRMFQPLPLTCIRCGKQSGARHTYVLGPPR